MKSVSRTFELRYGHPEGCSQCGCILYEGDRVAYVDDEITCCDCIERLWSSTLIGRKAKKLLE